MTIKYLYTSFRSSSSRTKKPQFARKRAVWGHYRSARMLRVNASVLADYISLVGNLLQNQIKLNHQRKPVAVIPLRSTCNWTRV